jgi:hypothetical protein
MESILKNAVCVTVAIIAGLVLGCGAKGVMPKEKLSKAGVAIKSAQTAEAVSYAPLELRIAEDKLSEAQAAAEREDYEGAGRLAEEALVNAQLAEKKADAEKAKRAAQEMRGVIESLRSTAQETVR